MRGTVTIVGAMILFMVLSILVRPTTTLTINRPAESKACSCPPPPTPEQLAQQDQEERDEAFKRYFMNTFGTWIDLDRMHPKPTPVPVDGMGRPIP